MADQTGIQDPFLLMAAREKARQDAMARPPMEQTDPDQAMLEHYQHMADLLGMTPTSPIVKNTDTGTYSTLNRMGNAPQVSEPTGAQLYGRYLASSGQMLPPQVQAEQVRTAGEIAKQQAASQGAIELEREKNRLANDQLSKFMGVGQDNNLDGYGRPLPGSDTPSAAPGGGSMGINTEQKKFKANWSPTSGISLSEDTAGEDVPKLALAVAHDPDYLASLEQKDAKQGAAVRGFLASLPADHPIRQALDQSNSQLLDKSLQTAQNLSVHPGVGGLTGVPNVLRNPGSVGRLLGLGPNWTFGDTAGAKALNDQLGGLLTLPKISLLKGMGRVTDREFAVLQSAMSRLQNTAQGTSDWRQALSEVQNTLMQEKARRNQMQGGGAAQMQPGGLPPGYSVVSQ